MKRRQSDKYILNSQGEPRPVNTLEEWAAWFEGSRDLRVVKQEWVDNVRVSTVFLSIDHNLFGGDAPILWETMCFSNVRKFSGLCTRCAGNREQAEAMHAKMLRRVKKLLATSQPKGKK